MPEINIDSALKCQNLCKKNKDCKYFTYLPSNKRCWLKSQKNKIEKYIILEKQL